MLENENPVNIGNVCIQEKEASTNSVDGIDDSDQNTEETLNKEGSMSSKYNNDSTNK